MQSCSPPTGVIHKSICLLPEAPGSWLKSLPALLESQALENAGARVRENIRHLPSFLCIFRSPFTDAFLEFYLFIFGCAGSSLLRRFFSIAELGFLPVASLGAEHRPQAHRLQCLWPVGSAVAVPGLQSTGSVIVEQGLSCSKARGIFPD